MLSVDDNYKNGDIRLVEGLHNWEGRVEVFLNGVWGTVISFNWDPEEAQVVCRQLELPTESQLAIISIECHFYNIKLSYVLCIIYIIFHCWVYYTLMPFIPEDAVPKCCAHYGESTGMIHITAISCNYGSEANISQCDITMHTAMDHTNEVGVVCGEGVKQCICKVCKPLNILY